MSTEANGDGEKIYTSSGLKRVVSDEALAKDNQKIFTAALIPPVLLTLGYIAFVKFLADGLYAEADTEPVKRVWIAGPIFFSILYLLTIYFGKKYMKTRDEFKIKPYIFTYNLYQCILNAWCVYAMIAEVSNNPWFQGMWGNTPQPGAAGFRITCLVWIHYNNKYIELLDTLWMIMRKKNKQISFLHCYHHLLLIWAWYFCCTVETGGDCYFGATVNSFIHVIMYGYYTLTLLGIPCPWKKWITNCQMIQFMCCLSHSIYVIYKGNMPITLPLAQGFVMINMLVLFGNFYIKSYMQKEGKKAKKIE